MQQVLTDDDEVSNDDSSWVKVTRGTEGHLGQMTEVDIDGGDGGNAREVDGFAVTPDSCSADGWPEVMAEVQVLHFCFKVRIQRPLESFSSFLLSFISK